MQGSGNPGNMRSTSVLRAGAGLADDPVADHVAAALGHLAGEARRASRSGLVGVVDLPLILFHSSESPKRHIIATIVALIVEYAIGDKEQRVLGW